MDSWSEAKLTSGAKFTVENYIQYSEHTISTRNKSKPKSTKKFNWPPAQTRPPKNKPDSADINPTPKILTKRKREIELETDGEFKAHFKKVKSELELDKNPEATKPRSTRKIQLAQQKMPKRGDLKTMFKKFKVGRCSAKDTRKAHINTYSNNPIGQPSSKDDCAANQHSPPEIRDRRRVEGESQDYSN